MRPFELGPLPLEVRGHAVEGLDQPPQLVGRGRGDSGVEVAARDAPRRPRQTIDRIGDALGHRVADAGAAEDEQQRGEQHPSIQRVDLLLDLPLPRGQRHGEDAQLPDGQRRRGDQILECADALSRDERRFVAQAKGAVDLGRRARRQQAGREQIALARGEQPRAHEDVHVLIDQPADPDHQVVVDAQALLRGAWRHEVLDHAAGRRRGAHGLLLDVRVHLPGDVVARDQHERHDGHEDRRDEREEQLAVEAGADLAQQRRRRRHSASEPVEQGVEQQEQQIRTEREHRELGQVHEVAERGDDGEAERVDAAAIVQQVDVVVVLSPRQRGPERCARLLDAANTSSASGHAVPATG